MAAPPDVTADVVVDSLRRWPAAVVVDIASVKEAVATGGMGYGSRGDEEEEEERRGERDYNPLNLPETDPRFDSSYDNMLIARVITNSANVATITNLVNRNVMQQAYFQEYTFVNVRGNQQSNPVHAPAIPIDWARTPIISIGQMGTSSLRTAFVSGGLDLGITGTANDARVSETTRYNTRTALQVFNPTGATISMTAHYQLVARA